MQSSQENKNEAAPSSRRKMIVRAGVVVGLLLAGSVALHASQSYFNVVLVKPPAQLNKELPALATVIGPWVMLPPDRKLDEEVVAQLGTEDYLLRRYKDTRKKEGDLGYVVSLNLNYYASGSATPHVPDVCWAANGLVLKDKGMFAVANVPHKDGSTSALRLEHLWFRPQPRNMDTGGLELDTGDEKFINVAYVFQVNDGYVTTAQEVGKHFWNPKAKYAYHTKIEMTLTDASGSPMACDPAEAEPIFADFLRTALPEIEDCLPDPQKLSSESGAAQANATAPASNEKNIER